MAVMVMTMIDDGHALQRCMERQAQEGEPRNSSQHRLFITIFRCVDAGDDVRAQCRLTGIRGRFG